MTTHWPDDERPVEVDPTVDDTVEPVDPELRDAELQAEEPLPLEEDELRPDGP